MAEKILNRRKNFVCYGGKSTGFAVTASQSGTDSFVVMDRADFYVTNIFYKCTSEELLFQIKIANNNVFERSLRIGLVASTNVYHPMQIPMGMNLIFKAKNSINLEYTDLSASTNTVFLVFRGYEIY